MSTLSKRSTVYFEPAIHHALKIRAASSHVSVSELIDEAVRLLMERAQESEISYEDLLNDLKQHGKI